MAYSTGQLCKEFNLARSTLLHYDTIGLLRPSNRGSNNYRIYTLDEWFRKKRNREFNRGDRLNLGRGAG